MPSRIIYTQTDSSKCGKDTEKWEPSYLASGTVKWWTQFEKLVILKILSINLHTNQQIHFWDSSQKK